MTEQLWELFGNLPAYLGGHLLLSLAALGAALAIALPLGIVASRRPVVGGILLALTGGIQTVPSLALLGLLVVVLGGLIGFWPAFIALVLYALLPILANTVVGIRGVDPALTEAARGLGMTDRQMLWQVELPLAAPVILGGVRTATVLIVGTATLATEVGGLSLGNYIFAGLGTLNHTATLFGCVAAALLAIVLDQLVHLLEIAARERSRRLAWVAVTGLALIVAGGLVQPVLAWWTSGNRAVIGGLSFNEQYVLTRVLGDKLEARGFQPDIRDALPYGIALEAVRQNQIDCMVAYTGDISAMLLPQATFATPDAARSEVKRYLEEEYGVHCLGELGYQSAYCVAVTGPRAADWKLRSVADLAAHARTHLKRPLRLGGDLVFFERNEWSRLKKEYEFPTDVVIVPLEPTLMFGAVGDGSVDAIVGYTSDGRIPKFGLVLLDDPRGVFPPYDALLLVSRSAFHRPGFVPTLKELLGKLDLATMQATNLQVDVEGQSPRRVATWLGKRLRSPAP